MLSPNNWRCKCRSMRSIMCWHGFWSNFLPFVTSIPGHFYGRVRCLPWCQTWWQTGLNGKHAIDPQSSTSFAASTCFPIRRRERSQDLRRQARLRPPPRVESTPPRVTSPELSSDEEENQKLDELQSELQHYAPQPPRWDASADDQLQLEFHTDCVSNPKKRRRFAGKPFFAV